MKIRTLDELTDRLSAELAWRKKELADLKFLIDTKADTYGNTLAKCGVAYLYAHWEGFIKLASVLFLEFVTTQRLRNEELSRNLLTLSMMGKTNFPYQTKKPSDVSKITDFFLDRMSDRATINTNKSIDTAGNLSSKVLKEIAWDLGLDFSPFKTREKFIDEKLLGRRNNIAHGKDMQIDPKEYEEMRVILIELISNFKTQLENLAALKQYLKQGA